MSQTKKDNQLSLDFKDNNNGPVIFSQAKVIQFNYNNNTKRQALARDIIKFTKSF